MKTLSTGTLLLAAVSNGAAACPVGENTTPDSMESKDVPASEDTGGPEDAHPAEDAGQAAFDGGDACGDAAHKDAGTDGGHDIGNDSGHPGMDAALDGGLDAGPHDSGASHKTERTPGGARAFAVADGRGIW
ncbi:MAG: hypothetical protein HY897_15375 [Deltaproteobacteria bacterium]|nr:hypothetical protein [Deltaproteobacteria bacterium]